MHACKCLYIYIYIYLCLCIHIYIYTYISPKIDCVSTAQNSPHILHARCFLARVVADRAGTQLPKKNCCDVSWGKNRKSTTAPGDELSWDQTGWDNMRKMQNDWDQMRAAGVGWEEDRRCDRTWDEMTWKKLRKDGPRWNEMKWVWMRWDVRLEVWD